jgi:hypothetical protein
MGTTTITFRVDDAEHRELAHRAERDKVSLSDYIRVRLGLRGQGSESDDVEVQSEPQLDVLRDQLAEHGRRLDRLEAAAGGST